MHPILFRIGAIVIPSYGVVAALGVLMALGLAMYTARLVRIAPAKIWNLCVLSLFSALAVTRLVLVAANFGILRTHPAWLLGLAMVHHPLLAGIGTVAGGICGLWYQRRNRLLLSATTDALAAPIALGLAMEQAGALLAGSGFGTDANPSLLWAVTYSNPLTAVWSGTPLGVPLHPVQAYAALSYLVLAIALILWLPRERQKGDVTGLCLIGMGIASFVNEFWRDMLGRGSIFKGVIDGPQVVAVAMVIAGGIILRERPEYRVADPPEMSRNGGSSA